MSKDLHIKINRDRFRERLLKYTRKTFQLLPQLNKPRILDVGCGSGVPTLELARLSKGEVIGIDIDQSLLDELNRKIEVEGLSNLVTTKRCSMFEMDFPDESFDIIWAEGSISVIGFERGLKEWRPYSSLMVSWLFMMKLGKFQINSRIYPVLGTGFSANVRCPRTLIGQNTMDLWKSELRNFERNTRTILEHFRYSENIKMR